MVIAPLNNHEPQKCAHVHFGIEVNASPIELREKLRPEIERNPAARRVGLIYGCHFPTSYQPINKMLTVPGEVA